MQNTCNFNIDSDSSTNTSLEKSIPDKEYQLDAYCKLMKVINMGLPSGNLWCIYNIGSVPECIENTIPDHKFKKNTNYWLGRKYQWGNIIHVDNDAYRVENWQHYKYAKSSSTQLTKYCQTKNKHFWNTFDKTQPDDLTSLLPEDDVATQVLGKNFCIPSKKDFEELLENCNTSWVENYDDTKRLDGFLFMSKINRNKLFFPSVTYNPFSKNDDDEYLNAASYWTSDLCDIRADEAYNLFTHHGWQTHRLYITSTSRSMGCYVRGIIKQKEEN